MSRTVHSDRYPADVTQPALDDPHTTAQERIAFIKHAVTDAATDGVVIPLRGDIESTVAATLAVTALDAESITGLVVATNPTRDNRVSTAQRVATDLGIPYRTLPLTPFIESITQTVLTELGHASRTACEPMVTTQPGHRQ